VCVLVIVTEAGGGSSTGCSSPASTSASCRSRSCRPSPSACPSACPGGRDSAVMQPGGGGHWLTPMLMRAPHRGAVRRQVPASLLVRQHQNLVRGALLLLSALLGGTARWEMRGLQRLPPERSPAGGAWWGWASAGVIPQFIAPSSGLSASFVGDSRARARWPDLPHYGLHAHVPRSVGGWRWDVGRHRRGRWRHAGAAAARWRHFCTMML
jgi:hypothetical protein